MSPREEIARLARGLTELLRRAHVPLYVMSGELGHHANYLTRVFTGHLPMKVREVFAILAAVHVDPKDFFDLFFPFGGPAVTELLRRPPPGFEPDPVLRDTLRQEREARGELVLQPEQWAKKAGSVLREHLRRKRVNLRQASMAAGMGPDALGQALRGYTQITFQHVFAAIEAGGSPPGRFFMDLFGAPDDDLLEGLRWSMYLDEIEKGFEAMAEQAKARLEAQRAANTRAEATATQAADTAEAEPQSKRKKAKRGRRPLRRARRA